jgi:hypothetical protein
MLAEIFLLNLEAARREKAANGQKNDARFVPVTLQRA